MGCPKGDLGTKAVRRPQEYTQSQRVPLHLQKHRNSSCSFHPCAHHCHPHLLLVPLQFFNLGSRIPGCFVGPGCLWYRQLSCCCISCSSFCRWKLWFCPQCGSRMFWKTRLGRLLCCGCRRKVNWWCPLLNIAKNLQNWRISLWYSTLKILCSPRVIVGIIVHLGRSPRRCRWIHTLWRRCSCLPSSPLPCSFLCIPFSLTRIWGILVLKLVQRQSLSHHLVALCLAHQFTQKFHFHCSHIGPWVTCHASWIRWCRRWICHGSEAASGNYLISWNCF